MKRVRIDFAAPSLARTLFRTHAAGWALCLLALVLALAALGAGAQMLARQRADQARLAAARLHASVPAPPPVTPPLPIPDAQAGAVNAAVLQLNLPWGALHDAISAATPNSIALLALEPDARKRSMKITAEARSSDAMIGYIEQLKREPLFAAVALMRHEINQQDPNQPIRFQLDAQWVAR